MKLLFINELGPNYTRMRTFMNLYLVVTIEELWGEDWDSRPAHGKPGPPELQYIEK